MWYGTVRDWFKTQGKGNVTFVESCTRFSEPTRKSFVRDCPGKNCFNLTILSKELAVKRWFWHFHVLFQKRAKAPEVSILFFCDNGVWRSVGMAILLEWVLSERGCTVSVEHFAETLGEWSCLKCQGTCAECKWKSREHAAVCAEAKENVLNAWRSARGGSESSLMQLPPRTGQGPGPHVETSGPGPRARALRVAIPVLSHPNR